MGDFGPPEARKEFDFYPTPSWMTLRLLERLELPGGNWLEPCAGNGNIIKVVNSLRTDVNWKAVEIQPQLRPKLDPLIGTDNLMVGDWLEMKWPTERPDVIITNPPYSLVNEFVAQSVLLAKSYTCMMLRLSFVASDKRAAFLRRQMPDVYVIPNRPNLGPGVSDSTEYAWFVWPAKRQGTGKIELLDDTSGMERKMSEKEMFD